MCVQVRKYLSHLDIDKIAKSSSFTLRKARKLTAQDFLHSFLIVFCKPNFTFRQWVCQINLLIGKKYSFQMLSKKCSENCLSFVQAILINAIQNQAKKVFKPSAFSSHFGRVLLEDSTCFKLSKSMLKAFSGAGNSKSKAAMFKVHFCYDLLTMNTLSYLATKINENDASKSANILQYLKAGDLVLRDMGYLSNKILNEIGELKAFFISRLKDNYKYYLPNTETEFDLADALAKANRKGQNSLMRKLTIGKSKELTATVIAVKLTPEQVDKRIKKYNRKRSNDQKMSKAKKQLLQWSIFVTNIENDRIDIEEIFKLYSLRWQIELIFKTWKSRFGIDSILEKYTGNDPNKILILFYLSLLFCISVFKPLFIKYKQIMHKKYSKELSVQKFASLVINHLSELHHETKIMESMVLRLGCHDESKSKTSHYQIIYEFQT